MAYCQSTPSGSEWKGNKEELTREEREEGGGKRARHGSCEGHVVQKSAKSMRRIYSIFRTRRNNQIEAVDLLEVFWIA